MRSPGTRLWPRGVPHDYTPLVALGSPRPFGFGDPYVGAATAGAAGLVAAQVMGKSLRDTLFVRAFGVERLPLAMLAAAILSGGFVVALARASSVRSPRVVVVFSLSVSASVLLAAWAVADSSEGVAALLTYLQSAALSAACVSVFWSLISESFDPHAARAVVPRIIAGATLGGLMGGVVAWRAAPYVRAHHLLPIVALLNLVAIPAALRLRALAPRAQAVSRQPWKAILSELPYLRAVGSVVLLVAVTQAILDYLLVHAAADAFPDEHGLLAFFAVFQTSVGVASFLLQIGVSRSLLERFSPGVILGAPPALLLVVTCLSPLAPALVGAVLMRGVDGALGASLHRSAYEVLFTPMNSGTKRQMKPVLDVGIDRLGTLLGSAFIMATVALAGGRAGVVLVVGVGALAVGRSFLSFFLQAGYRRTLAEELRRGRLDLSHASFIDPATFLTLSRALGQSEGARLLAEVQRVRGDPGRESKGPSPGLSMAGFDLPAPELPSVDETAEGDTVLREMTVLRTGELESVRSVLRAGRTQPLIAPLVIALLADDRLARDAADWLSVQKPAPVGLLSDALLEERLPDAARRRVARLLGKCGEERARKALMEALLRVPTAVRIGVAQALAHAAVAHELDPEPILAALKELALQPSVESEADRLEEVFFLLAAAFPQEPMDAAFRSLRRGGRTRGTALEWLSVLLPHDVKTALWPAILQEEEGVASSPRGAAELRRAMLEADESAP